MNITCINWDLRQWTANCFTVIVAAVNIKMTCIIETLYYWRNLETGFSANTDFKYLFIVYVINIKILHKLSLLFQIYVWQFWKSYLKVSNNVTKVNFATRI